MNVSKLRVSFGDGENTMIPFFRLYIYRHPIFPLDIQDKMLQSVIGHLKSGTLASVTGKFLAW